MIKDIPQCLGHRDYYGEFDCESGIDCEYCLCLYHQCGGLTHPETGYTYSTRFAERTWGKPAFLSKPDPKPVTVKVFKVSEYFPL